MNGYTGEVCDVELSISMDAYVVDIRKVGGGTPGNTYTGDWVVCVQRNYGIEGWRTIIDPSELPLRTGVPTSHLGAALIALDVARSYCGDV